MRQAIVSLRDEDFTGSEEVISVFRDAGVHDVDVLSCDWSGGVIRAHVKNKLDEEPLDAADTVVWWEQVSSSGSGYTYLIEMAATEESGPMAPQTDDVLPVNSIEFDDDGFTFDISGSQEGIREVISGFEAADIDLTLRGLHEYRSKTDILEALTDRQREVLQTAYENGYYDVPRGITTNELAGELGVDGSTVSEHLQRAERNLIAAALND
jgi:DNA-binding CsgD family transcriptional regulator